MISRGAPIFLAAAVIAACSGGGRAANSPTASVAVASPSPTPVIDVYDMMGAFPPATFFVVDKSDVRAIALLNHATRYTIATSGKDVQVSAAGNAGRVYVLDQTSDGARLRWFDINNGAERAAQTVSRASVVSTGIGHGALAVDESIGLVYALVHEPSGIAVESFDWFTLRPARQVFRDFRCGDRLVAAAKRVAVACLTTGPVAPEATVGLLVVDDSGQSFKLGTRFAINSIGMLPDGTLMAGAADGSLVRLARQKTELEKIDWLTNYGKGLIPDGIAANGDCCFYFGVIDATANDVQSRLIAGGTAVIAFPEISQPTGGLFVQAPFAYFVVNGRARHVDINQGFGEVMADVGAGALPGAVSNR